MKIALCYSGQLGAFLKAFPSQKKSFIRDDMDIYAYTSNLISQKNNSAPNYKPESKVYEYLPAGKGWRANLESYGIIYQIGEKEIRNILSPITKRMVKAVVEKEQIDDSLNDWNMSKWEWLKKRQLSKLYKSNQILKDSGIDYDLVVRSRFEFGPNIKIEIEKIFDDNKGDDNKIFLFGGWKCTPPMVFMDEFICDGFAFGTPKVMDIFSSLGLRDEPYPYNLKYKDCWDKFGDNVEHQFKSHLDANGIEVVHIGNSRGMYHLWR